MASFRDLQQYVNNANVNAYLNMLMDAEGTSQYANPYVVAGGGKVMIQDLSQAGGFPKWGFTQTDGKKNTSSAAGAFQFLNSTYDDLRRQGYEVNDFQPQTQRMAAIALLKQNSALPYIVNGDFDTAIRKSAGTWASLPGSPYAQKTRDMKFVQDSLRKHLNDPNITLNNYDQYATAGGQQNRNPFMPPMQQGVTQVENPYAQMYNQANTQATQQEQVAEADQYRPRKVDYFGIVDPDLAHLVGEQNRNTQNRLWGT